MNIRLSVIFRSKRFKRITLIMGITFFVLTLFISLDPGPFLKAGYPGVFVFNILGAGTLLFLPLARHMNILGLSFVTALGMAINDSVSWVVGRSGDEVIPRSKQVLRVEKTIKKYGPSALFFWSLIPFPYDVAGLIAGYLELPYRSFITPTFLGKFVRFILLGMGILTLTGKMHLF